MSVEKLCKKEIEDKILCVCSYDESHEMIAISRIENVAGEVIEEEKGGKMACVKGV